MKTLLTLAAIAGLLSCSASGALAGDATAPAAEQRLDEQRAADERYDELVARLARALYDGRVYRSAPTFVDGERVKSLEREPLTPGQAKHLRPQVEIVTLPASPLGQGAHFQAKFRNVTVATLLRAITDEMKVRAFVDAELEKSFYIIGDFEATTLEGLLNQVGGDSVDYWVSPAGTYFFSFDAVALMQSDTKPKSKPKKQARPQNGVDPDFVLPRSD